MILCLLICPVFMFAQAADTIMLNTEKTTIRDTAYVSFYTQASKQYASNNNFDNALIFGVKALELAMYLGYEKGILESWKSLGRISSIMGKHELALDYQHQALELYEKKQNEQGMLECMNELADIYIRTKEYEQAMEYKFQALKLEEKFKLKFTRALGCYFNKDCGAGIGRITQSLLQNLF